MVTNAKLLTVEDVAESLQKSVDWVYKSWKVQGLPFRKVGGELRMLPDELDEWVRSLTVGARK